MTEVYMKSKTPFSVFQPSPHISTSFSKCLLIALSILQRNKWNKHSVIPEQKKCMTKENFLHSRSLDAFHLSYPSVNENIFLNLRSLMKQKKSTCRAAFPTATWFRVWSIFSLSIACPWPLTYSDYRPIKTSFYQCQRHSFCSSYPPSIITTNTSYPRCQLCTPPPLRSPFLTILPALPKQRFPPFVAIRLAGGAGRYFLSSKKFQA